jgi:hypothetical protein
MCKLINGLRKEKWIIDPESPDLLKMKSPYHYPLPSEGFFMRTIKGFEPGNNNLQELYKTGLNNGIKLIWPVTSCLISGLNYPLKPAPFPEFCSSDNCCYDFEIHLSQDYIYHTSEFIDSFIPHPVCSCGKELLYYPVETGKYSRLAEDPFLEPRLFYKCPDCGAFFDPVNLVCKFRDSDINKEVLLRGGAAYSFAVVVDCHKAWVGSSKYKPGLKQLIENITGIETYEVPDFY